MPTVGKLRILHWTLHVKAKMKHYGLSRARVLRILHAPKRVEEGIAPETMAAMQPVGITYNRQLTTDNKDRETWKQELWVMVQDKPRVRTIISAWRYPGMTKPRSAVAMAIFRQEYGEYLAKTVSEMEEKEKLRKKLTLAAKWHRVRQSGNIPKIKRKWPSRPFRKRAIKPNVITLD